MREIKYRGYSKNFNMMILNETWESASDGMVKACNQYIKEHNIDSIPVERGTFLPTKDKDLILMQYTGLKDKNGKEIYEGDIVTSHNGSIQGVVLYQAPEFIIKRKLTHKTWTQFIFNPAEKQYQEVIGNIYENPKLLELNTTDSGVNIYG